MPDNDFDDFEPNDIDWDAFYQENPWAVPPPAPSLNLDEDLGPDFEDDDQ